jgi:hypothetical protein
MAVATAAGGALEMLTRQGSADPVSAPISLALVVWVAVVTGGGGDAVLDPDNAHRTAPSVVVNNRYDRLMITKGRSAEYSRRRKLWQSRGAGRGRGGGHCGGKSTRA